MHNECTLRRVDDQPIPDEEVEDGAKVQQVGTAIQAGDEDIIQVDKDVGETTEDPVHHPLEGLGGVLEPERHRQVLEEAERG